MATKYISALTGPQMDKALLDMNNHISEAWAVGERDGVPVTTSDETYHNNAKYYAEQTAGSESIAQNYATQAGASAAAATGSASNAASSATAAADSANAASTSATTAANQAVRAKDEADRAEAIVGGQFVTYGAPQTLTEGQKKQARDNIGAKYSNPNLIDNPWFTVNQRGQTTYTGTNTSPKTVDRWGLGNGSSVTLTVENDGITFASSGAYHAKLDQTPEPNLLTPYIGKEMTFSALINGVVESFTFTLTTTETRRGIIAGLHVYITPSTIYFYKLASAGAFFVKINAVKLELGSVSTLANDSAPDYATELQKCRMSTADSGDRYANAIMGVYCQSLDNRTGYLDFDDVMIPGFYVNGTYGTALIVLRTGAYGYSGLVQIAIKYNDLKLNIREYHSGVWSAWVVK